MINLVLLGESLTEAYDKGLLSSVSTGYADHQCADYPLYCYIAVFISGLI